MVHEHTCTRGCNVIAGGWRH